MAKPTTIRRLRPWPDKLRPALLAALLAALGQTGVFAGTDSAAPGAAPGNTVTVALAYQETSHSIASLNALVAVQSAPFKKEPAASGRIIRGHLNFGEHSSNSIPFIWQRDTGKLFLDLNHNQDLTDDPAGVFSLPRQWPASDQTFTNAHLQFDTPSGKCPVLADINIWNYGSRTTCRLELRSFWQSKVALTGQDWQVGVIPNDLDQTVSFEKNELLLRPWEKRDQPINTYGVSRNTFPVTRKLFVGGHAYQVNWMGGTQNGEIKLTLQFTEQSVALGELKITGQYIRRLTLSGGPYFVILDQPAGTVKVPVGSYAQPDVLLQQGDTEAGGNAIPWQSGPRITVSDKTPAVLNAGGPLTNTVAVTRRGRNLRLDYRLLGAGGTTYELAHQDRDRPPEFAIYRGGRKVASGRFAFG